MAPRWTLALLVAISVLLGIGQASITCESDEYFQCVDRKNCRPSTEYRSNVPGCSRNKVCCANEDIRTDQPCRDNHVCVADNLCRSELDFRSADRCPDQMICCKVEDANNLSIEDPL